MIDFDKNYTNRKIIFYIWQFLLETKGFYEDFAIQDFYKVYMAVSDLKLPYTIKLNLLCIIFAVYENYTPAMAIENNKCTISSVESLCAEIYNSE